MVEGVDVTDVSSTTATLMWKWKKIWLEEQGQIDEIKGEFTGFKVKPQCLTLIYNIILV